MAIPTCRHCGDLMIQVGRYADWTCRCCDQSANCPHVSAVKRMIRKLSGRRT